MLMLRKFTVEVVPSALGSMLPDAAVRDIAAAVMARIPEDGHETCADLGVYTAAMMGNRAAELADSMDSGGYLPEVMRSAAYAEGAEGSESGNLEFAVMYGRPDGLLESLRALCGQSRAELHGDAVDEFVGRHESVMEAAMDWARCLQQMQAWMTDRLGMGLEQVYAAVSQSRSRRGSGAISSLLSEAESRLEGTGAALAADVILLRITLEAVMQLVEFAADT